MKLWERNSAYNRAKQIVRRFLWVVVVLGLLVPLAVHNMRVSVVVVLGLLVPLAVHNTRVSCGGAGAVSSSCCS